MSSFNYQNVHRMNILITAVGSMSADCAIPILKARADKVIGCDIYPKEWLIEAAHCDKFYQAPLAREEDMYIRFLMQICTENKITHLIPLTDVEIDVINKYREIFESCQIILCMPSMEVLGIVRNKYKLYQEFKRDTVVPFIKTILLNEENIEDITFPCIAKPFDGRSSEGLVRLDNRSDLSAIRDRSRYIVQEYIPGNVFTVDYVRCDFTGQDFAIMREELLRTKNGAGLTVRLTGDSSLYALACYIGRRLLVNGCVNMEFIKKEREFYLIDINPRFSAGVAFSVMEGYDMVTNHLNCFSGKSIDAPIDIEEKIITKRYKEEVILL